VPRKPKPEKPSAEVLAPIPADILDQIVREGSLTAADVETATRRFKKALIERALGAELSHYLGYAPGTAKPELASNHRNGTSGKTVLTDDGPVPIEVPRDREGTFEPQLIGKHERRFTGFDDKVIALYARGMTVREIQAFLTEDVCGRRLAGLDQHSDRRGCGRGDGVAKPAARADVSRGVLRRSHTKFLTLPRRPERRLACALHSVASRTSRARYIDSPNPVVWNPTCRTRRVEPAV